MYNLVEAIFYALELPDLPFNKAEPDECSAAEHAV
jgi:hypothetical protein